MPGNDGEQDPGVLLIGLETCAGERQFHNSTNVLMYPSAPLLWVECGENSLLPIHAPRLWISGRGARQGRRNESLNLRPEDDTGGEFSFL